MSRRNGLILCLVASVAAIGGWYVSILTSLGRPESLDSEPFTALAVPVGLTVSAVESKTLPDFRLGSQREFRCQGKYSSVVEKFRRANPSVKFLTEGRRTYAKVNSLTYVSFQPGVTAGFVSILVVMQL